VIVGDYKQIGGFFRLLRKAEMVSPIQYSSQNNNPNIVYSFTGDFYNNKSSNGFERYKFRKSI